MSKLQLALNNPIWINHSINSKYMMDEKDIEWRIAYYPIFECGKTGKIYEEPRALVETPINNGTDFREVPLRYLVKKEN